MSHRSPWNWMEGSNYKDECSQWADSVRGMSNRRQKRKISPRKEKIRVNCNNEGRDRGEVKLELCL